MNSISIFEDKHIVLQIYVNGSIKFEYIHGKKRSACLQYSADFTIYDYHNCTMDFTATNKSLKIDIMISCNKVHDII